VIGAMGLDGFQCPSTGFWRNVSEQRIQKT
jgi:hypothetical protein